MSIGQNKMTGKAVAAGIINNLLKMPRDGTHKDSNIKAYVKLLVCKPPKLPKPQII